MLKRIGAGQGGFSDLPEYVDLDCVVRLSPGEFCFQGQILCRDLTQTVGPYGADILVLPTHVTSGPSYGVYQIADAISNLTALDTYTPTVVRAYGQGVVIADGSNGAINVGSPLLTPPGGGAKSQGAWGLGIWGEFDWGTAWGNNATAIPSAGTITVGAYVGNALATGTAGQPPGYQLIANQGAAAVVNVAIQMI